MNNLNDPKLLDLTTSPTDESKPLLDSSAQHNHPSSFLAHPFNTNKLSFSATTSLLSRSSTILFLTLVLLLLLLLIGPFHRSVTPVKQDLTSQKIMISMLKTQLKDLEHKLKGSVLYPHTKGYTAANHVWNQAYQAKAAAIIDCHHEDDVLNAVQFLVAAKLPFRVLGAGHSFAGYGVQHDGIVISTRALQYVEINPSTNTYKAGSGTTSLQVAQKLLPMSLASVFGICPSVGLGGYIQGGGVGLISRKYGLAADNLVEARVVLANGSLVVANHHSHKDLFWAIRGGGGGNFGVVTEFTCNTYPIRNQAVFGRVCYNQSDFPQAFAKIMHLPSQYPDEFVCYWDGSIADPNGICVNAAYIGQTKSQVQHGLDYIKTLFDRSDIPRPISNDIRIQNWNDFVRQSNTYDGLLFQGFSGFLSNDTATPALIKQLAQSMLSFQHPHREYISLLHGMLGGQIARLDPHQNAFAWRDTALDIGLHIAIPNTVKNAQVIFQELQAPLAHHWKQFFKPHLKGSYVNYVNPALTEGQKYLNEYYGKHLEKLSQIKRLYDPNQVFVFEQSIPLFSNA